MKLIVEGGSLNSPIPRLVRKAVDLLKAYPDGRLLTPQALSAKLGCPHTTMRQYTTHTALKDYKISVNPVRAYFGNPRTIAAARQQLT